MKIGDAPELGRYITQTTEKIKPEGLAKTRQVYPGDLVLSNSMSFGRPYIMAIRGCIHDGWLLIRDAQKHFDPIFLCHMLGAPQMLNQYRMFAAGSTVNNLNKELVGKAIVSLPSKDEQREIGIVLDRLDSLITLHQRKYDKLCVLKKSMLDKMFPKGGSLYPEIRFAGFTDPWEQRKLSSTCEQLSRTINPLETPNEEFTEYSMPAFDNNETAETVIGNSMNSLRKIVDRPCLLVNKLNVRKKRIWHVPRPEANAVCSSEFVPFSSHSSDLSFIKISLLSERITAYLESCSSGSSNSQKRVTPEIIMSSEIIAPSLAEQRRIGAFFDRLDSLITLHQRKYDKLCVLKKSMLDKMFPKGGSLYPEIRFAGFTDPWEQRKLGELFEEHSEKDRDDLPALTIIQGGGTVHRDESNRNLQFDRNSLSNYKVVDTGDFIVHLRSFEGGLEKATCCGLVSPAYHIFRGKNVDSDFYYLYFRSKRFIDADLKPHVYGIRDGRSIDIEGMKTIFIPWTNLAEQRRIGAFFDRLDSLITLHQRKLELLRNIKKSMLDKMFV